MVIQMKPFAQYFPVAPLHDCTVRGDSFEFADEIP